MSDEIRLSSGQRARMVDGGVVEVLPAGDHYRMDTVHSSGAGLIARSVDYRPLLDFLKQLEPLGYGLHTLQVEPGQP